MVNRLLRGSREAVRGALRWFAIGALTTTLAMAWIYFNLTLFVGIVSIGGSVAGPDIDTDTRRNLTILDVKGEGQAQGLGPNFPLLNNIYSKEDAIRFCAKRRFAA